MALLDAYATATQYRDASGDRATGTDATLNAQLVGVSRLLEKALGVAPGAFNSVEDQTVYFDSHGGPRLRFRDDQGLQWFVQSVDSDGIGVDTEGDGSFDGATLDLAAAGVVGYPTNAAAGGEPYRGLELLSYAALPAWPHARRSVRVRCTTGWSAVPQLITELVIHRTKELRDRQKAGPAGELASFDGGVVMSPGTAWLFHEAERLYGSRLPAVA